MTLETLPRPLGTESSNPLKQINKAVVIVHPDNRTTGFPSTTESPMYSHLGAKFLDIQSKLLGRYRKQGYTNLAFVYGDTLPDHLSPIYPHDLIDAYIATPTTNAVITDEILAGEFQDTVGQLTLSPDADIVIGGYRAGICVDAMKKALEDLGHTPRINYLLTNQAVFMVMSREARRMLGPMYDKEHFEEDRATWQGIKEGKITLNT